MKPTARLTDHARERCAEMGISTKVAKAIVRTADLVYPGRPTWNEAPTLINISREHPEYAVVTLEEQPDLIVTVLFNHPEPYVRDGATFRPAKQRVE